MREILFRGKRVDNSEWVEGLLSKGRLQGYEGNTLQPCIDHEEKGVVLSSVVIPCSVGQFTGMFDKIGQRLFEGDIVKIYNQRGETDIRDGVVYWINHDQAYCICRGLEQNVHYGDLGNFDDGKFLEVIGNIHDNPELDEKSKTP